MPIIETRHLRKVFRSVRRYPGVGGAIRSLFSREYVDKVAVEDINLVMEAGELVGYIGPNGAGKSTTIMMLTGILVPTSGEIRVAGLVPYQKRKENARNIGVVFGQRSQLYWDLPLRESFEL
ncbi:MAG: ATP-binding cassette domain-containing protein, partial [Candidatus Eremiobacteraeota bacterium]|nr:ATP-binding cassette domain-containing protein [Candidatus Eremiobacteraeota bacterium]